MSVESVISGLSPTSWWKLDETSGTTATDSGSAGKNGTYSGDFTLAQSTSGAPDGGDYAYFGGTNAKVAVGATSDFTELWQNNKSGTFVFFFKKDTASRAALETLFATNGASTANNGAFMAVDDRGALTIPDDTKPMLRSIVKNGTLFAPVAADTNWHMAVWLKSDQYIRLLYDNAVKAGICTDGQANYPSSGTSNHALTLAAVNSSLYFKGHLGQVAFWNSALTLANLTSIYDAFTKSACSITKALRDASGTLLTSQTGLKGRLSNTALPSTGAIDWQGTFDTDGSGLITNASPALVTSLSNGSTAWFEWTDSAGTAYATGQKAFGGPVTLTVS